MPPKVQQKSKEAKMAAAMAGGKSKKKKWSKGKVRDQVANKVLFDEDTYARAAARGGPQNEADHAVGARRATEDQRRPRAGKPSRSSRRRA